jgi:hypothetical protein
MNKKTIQLIPSIILYIFAVLLAVYAIWAYSYWVDIISQARAAGQLAASGNEFDVASYYMDNCGRYLVYALLLASAGLILQRKQPTQKKPVPSVGQQKNDAADDELDEWFDDENSVDNAKTKDG